MRDIEEDKDLRQEINLFRDPAWKEPAAAPAHEEGDDDDENEAPEVDLAELLDGLTLNDKAPAEIPEDNNIQVGLLKHFLINTGHIYRTEVIPSTEITRLEDTTKMRSNCNDLRVTSGCLPAVLCTHKLQINHIISFSVAFVEG
mmetsp:Transcript_12197/g.10457  ORF Transcript_12197/g.10457 Transcript_12197/m.10457 type:complete len:144 (-) Transcript_12197:280-711(-)